LLSEAFEAGTVKAIQAVWKDRRIEPTQPVEERHDDVSLQREIDSLLISGQAATMAEAERLYLDTHLHDIVVIAEQMSDDEFRRHGLVRLLLAHGSRPWEDSLE
jgi:hypothetical protein